MSQVSVSILSADSLHLGDELKRAEPYVDRLHYDVMDGHFVHNLSFGLPELKQIRPVTTLLIDTHLMITNPEEFISEYSSLSDVVYLHWEAIKYKDAENLAHDIQAAGAKAGISINPETPVSDIQAIIHFFSHILVMSVHPGAGGQECMIETLDKIPEIKKIHPTINVCVDGGMNSKTAPLALTKGADTLVSGSYILKSRDIEGAVKSLRK